MGKLNIPFPYKKYQFYKKIVGDMIDENLSEKQVNQILLMAIEDFLDGSISIDNLASIGSKLIDVAMKNSYFVLDILESASELSFYVRRPKQIATFKSLLEDVVSYYESEKEKEVNK